MRIEETLEWYFTIKVMGPPSSTTNPEDYAPPTGVAVRGKVGNTINVSTAKDSPAGEEVPEWLMAAAEIGLRLGRLTPHQEEAIAKRFTALILTEESYRAQRVAESHILEAAKAGDGESVKYWKAVRSDAHKHGRLLEKARQKFEKKKSYQDGIERLRGIFKDATAAEKEQRKAIEAARAAGGAS
jgi:hypothetical protein